jgi:hypothetical protein
MELTLTEDDRQDLKRSVRSTSTPTGILRNTYSGQTGQYLARSSARTSSKAFVGFLDEVASGYALGMEIHIILGANPAHETKLVAELQKRHGNVHFHLTPSHSSWVNQWASPRFVDTELVFYPSG